MKKIKTLILSILLVILSFCTVQSQAQEVILPTFFNTTIQHYLATHPTSGDANARHRIDTLQNLPFLDDFSLSGEVYPDHNLWLDSSVYINTDYGFNPITLGVATFDGIDRWGEPYANTSSGYVGDHLTSRPIKLDYLNDTSIYLSFFYQRTGRGNLPDVGDSLVLEFHDPVNLNQWIWQWGIDGGAAVDSDDVKFKCVMIHITDSLFLGSGFQFRFKNYVSGYGNVDNWHIDYVRLDRYRTYNDTTILDMAFTQPASSILKDYTQMPWTHFIQDSMAEMQDAISVQIHNLDDVDHGSIQYKLRVLDNYDNIIYSYPQNTVSTDFTANAFISLNGTVHSGNDYFSFQPSYSNNSGQFKIVNYINKINGDKDNNNDTAVHIQKFYNYYAYDDGTAEQGYGLNAIGAKLAMQFSTTKSDTLRGVYIHFNQEVSAVGLQLFNLCVWKTLSPEVMQYQQIDLHPQPSYDDSLINGFHYYAFDTAQYIPTGTFYIGWIQHTNEILNLGLDSNTNANQSHLWYNTLGTWNQSLIYGTVMIRPMFGDSVVDVLGVKENPLSPSVSLSIFPVPTGNELYLNPGNNKQISDYNIYIYDVMGRKVFEQDFGTSPLIVSALSPGLYFVKMINPLTGETLQKKMVKK